MVFGTDLAFDMADVSALDLAQRAEPAIAAKVLGENALDTCGVRVAS